MSDPAERQGTTRQLREARIAVAFVFFAMGAVVANWATRIPVLMDNLGLSVTALSVALFAAPVAQILSMPLVGPLVTRYGSRQVTRICFVIWCFEFPLIAFAPNLIVLCVVMFAQGGFVSATDVAMNAHGLVLERRYGRPILSSFHAWYSIGLLLGAGTGALAAWAALDLRVHLLLAAGVALAGTLLLGPFMLRDDDRVTEEKQRFFVKPPRQLVALGIIAFVSLLSEGAASDWSAVYINKPLHASQGVAALGLLAFSVAMVIGRVYGDRLAVRFGPVVLTRIGGLLAAGSLMVALLVGHPVAALAGFAGMGLGLSAVVPTVFRAAGSRSDIAPGIGLASVSLIGYCGYVVGPPLIGSTAKVLGLPIALGIVALAMAVIGVLASSAAPTEVPARDGQLAVAED